MKKFLILIILFTAIGGTVNAKKIDTPNLPIGMALVKSGSGFKLFYKGAKSGNVRVAIYNDRGVQIHQETLHKIESFMRPYNFSSLTEGDYMVEISGVEGKQIQKFSYRKNHSGKLMRLVKLPGSKTKYILSVANKGTDVLKIKIFDGSNTLIFEEDQAILGDFARIYDLGHVEGKFAFEVSDKIGNIKSLTYHF